VGKTTIAAAALAVFFRWFGAERRADEDDLRDARPVQPGLT
jgi:hypothetical protein